MMRLLLLLKFVATWVAALLILFEEWGWEPLARLVGRLARLPFYAALERKVAALPSYAALAVFALPALALLPVKLLALYWIAAGHRLLGVGLVVAAKLLGTALVARLYQLTEQQLLRLPWFAALHARWRAWKRRVLARVRASAAWQAIGRVKLRARCGWRWLRLRLRRAGRATKKPTGE